MSFWRLDACYRRARDTHQATVEDVIDVKHNQRER